MTSLDIYRAARSSFSEDELFKKAKNLTIENEQELPKSGIVGDFKILQDGGFAFRYARIRKEHHDYFDEERPEYEEFTVIFLERGYVVLETAKKEVSNEIREFIEAHFLEETSLTEVNTGERVVRDVEDKCKNLYSMHVRPVSLDEPEKLKGTDKQDVSGTEFYERKIDEPLEKVKVDFASSRIDVKIGVDDDGTLILYGQNLSLSRELYLVDAVIEEIEKTERIENSVQSNLEGL